MLYPLTNENKLKIFIKKLLLVLERAIEIKNYKQLVIYNLLKQI